MPVSIPDSTDSKLPSIAGVPAREKALDSQVRVLKRDKPDEYYHEIMKLDIWYRQKLHTFKYFMRKHYGREEFTYAEAKRILKDFFIPCGNLMLHAVCRCLDPSNKRTINFAHSRRLLQSEKPSHNISSLKSLDVVDSYFYLHMKYLPLLSEASLPCHFETLIRSDMYIGKLAEIIQERTGLISKECQIFPTTFRYDLPIPNYFTLNQLKVDSGTPDRPGVLILYYTGELDFMHCPLLLCNYYCYYAISSRKMQRKKQQDTTEKEKDEYSFTKQDTDKSDIEQKMIQEERQRMLTLKKESVEKIANFSDILAMKR